MLSNGVGFCVVPVVKGKRQSPDVRGNQKSDAAETRLVRIDINDVGLSTLVREKNVNLDSHSHPQGHGSQQQRASTVYNDSFPRANQGFTETSGLNHHAHANTSASPRLAQLALF